MHAASRTVPIQPLACLDCLCPPRLARALGVRACSEGGLAQILEKVNEVAADANREPRVADRQLHKHGTHTRM